MFDGIWSFYQDQIIEGGRQTAFLLLLAFLISFGFCRLYTRLARVRNWGSGNVGGVHIHHMVVGIVVLLLAGFMNFALDPGHPWLDVLAVLFGVGAGLTLDEFALWLHLKDVYWAEEGRSSIDAVILATLVGGLVFVGGAPFGSEEEGSIVATAVAVSWILVTSSIAFLKGKFLLGAAGIFIPVLGLVAAIRLARPDSPWARRRYGKNEKKMRKAVARDRKRQARKAWVRDLIGGAPDPSRLPPPA